MAETLYFVCAIGGESWLAGWLMIQREEKWQKYDGNVSVYNDIGLSEWVGLIPGSMGWFKKLF